MLEIQLSINNTKDVVAIVKRKYDAYIQPFFLYHIQQILASKNPEGKNPT
jgi:hypothetical protein